MFSLFKPTLEKELKKLDKKYPTPDLKKLSEYKIKQLEINKQFNNITDCEYEIAINNILNKDKGDIELKVQELDILLKYRQISGIEYCKKKNDFLGKPWAAFRTNFDENANIDNPEIEVVYNKCFVEKLRNQGLPGDSDEEVVDQWLKYFFIAQLEQEDLSILDGEQPSQNERVKKTKMGNGSIIIG
jgi:hypothetical protein